eukprot:gene14591-17371_t
MVPADGAKSAHGGARTEIKNGCNTPGGTDWNPFDGKMHWLNVTQAITQLTTENRVTVYQMHGEEHDIIKIKYEKGKGMLLNVRDAPFGTKKIADVEVGKQYTGSILVHNGVARFWFNGVEIKDASFTIDGQMN